MDYFNYSNHYTTTVISTVAVVSLASYLFFFDYKRRKDPNFRNTIRKQRQQVAALQASIAKSSSISSSNENDADPLAASIPGLQAFLNQPMPATPDLKEAFFMDALSKGETLAKLGPMYFDLSATCFYKALKVYPSPSELVTLYQRTVPDAVFQLIMSKIADEVKSRHEQYFIEFPPADYNVRIKVDQLITDQSSSSAQPLKHRVLIATKDFCKGDLIFSESPLVSSTLSQHLLNKTVCTFCTRLLEPQSTIVSEKTGNVYCSDQCEVLAWDSYESLLYAEHQGSTCSSTSTLLTEFATANAHVPLSIVRFLAQMVREDMLKANNPAIMDSFGAWDHLERLKYLDLSATPNDLDDLSKLRQVIGQKVPGLDEFLTEERYLTLKGKFMFNQMAIFMDQGVRNVFSDNDSGLNQMRNGSNFSSSSNNNNVITGTGVYTAASYLTHSCLPNTYATYPNNNHVLHLIAKCDITKGDQLTIAYTDGLADMKVRSSELTKWRFTCQCALCMEQKLDDVE